MREFLEKIQSRRDEIGFPGAGFVKGARFNSDTKVLDKVRMDLFERLKLNRLPTVEQAIALIPKEDQVFYIDRALTSAAKSDHHYNLPK